MAYTVETASLNADKEDIFSLWKLAGNDLFPKKFAWIYENNPFGKANVWLVRHGISNKCVGIVALFPCPLMYKGELLRAAVAGDFFLLPKHRTAGPALMLMRTVANTLAQNKYDVIYTLPNKKSEPIIKRVGFELLGEKAHYVKLISAKPLLQKISFGQRIYPCIRPIVDSVVFYLNAAFFRGKWCKDRYSVSEEPGEQWSSLLTNNISPFSTHTLYQLSDLHWKFTETPTGKNFFFSTYKEDKIVGGVIYQKEGDELVVKKIYSSCGRALENFNMWRLFFGFARSQGIAKIRCPLMANNILQDCFRKLGFFERREKLAVFAMSPPGKDCSEFLDKDGWLLFQSDDDM